MQFRSPCQSWASTRRAAARVLGIVSAAGFPQVVGCGAGVFPQVSRRSYPAVVGWCRASAEGVRVVGSLSR